MARRRPMTPEQYEAHQARVRGLVQAPDGTMTAAAGAPATVQRLRVRVVAPEEDRDAPGELAVALALPWPPTGNTAVRHTLAGGHYLRPEVRRYRQEVARRCLRVPRVVGPYRLEVAFSPPDARRRDMDNALKSLLDALTHAGYLPDDSMTYMRELRARVDDDRAGTVTILVEELKMGEPCRS